MFVIRFYCNISTRKTHFISNIQRSDLLENDGRGTQFITFTHQQVSPREERRQVTTRVPSRKWRTHANSPLNPILRDQPEAILNGDIIY